MIADSSQTRILAKVNGPFLHARWWLWNLILDVHTLLHFGQMKVLAEDNRDATTSFCLLGLSFAASCLSASNFRLAFLTDECHLSWSEASCCHDRLSLQVVVMLSWNTMITLSFAELTEGDCFGHVYVFQPCDVAFLRTSSFYTWSCHLMPRMECKQRWWNRSSSPICF